MDLFSHPVEHHALQVAINAVTEKAAKEMESVLVATQKVAGPGGEGKVQIKVPAVTGDHLFSCNPIEAAPLFYSHLLHLLQSKLAK